MNRLPISLGAIAGTALLGSTLLGAALTGCGGDSRHVYDPPSADETATATVGRDRPEFDEEAFRDFGFVLYWDSYLTDEIITGLYLHGKVHPVSNLQNPLGLQVVGESELYAVTESNRLYQIDLHSGMVNWVVDVGLPIDFTETNPIGEFVYQPSVDGTKRYDEVYFIADGQLYGLDKENGALLFNVALPFTPSSPPAASETHVFVGAWDDRVYGVRKDDPDFPDWDYRTNDDVLSQPAVYENSLFTLSSDGAVRAFDPARGELRWTYNTEQRLLTNPAVHRSLLSVGAEDFNLYIFDPSGLVQDRYGAGAPITSDPVPVADRVYFTASEHGMVSLKRRPAGESSRRRHDYQWNVPEAQTFLARGSDDIYARSPTDRAGSYNVLRIDAEDGSQRDMIDLSNIDYWITNHNDPNSPFREESLAGGIMVFGYRNGWIMAAKEITTLPGGILDDSK